MALPKISYPIYEVNVQNKKYKFRPLLVKEEKLLLMAKASEDSTDIFSTIVQVVNNCALDESFDVTKLALFELEYVFLKLRGFSIGNQIELAYIDGEDKKSYEFKVDLNDVKIVKPEGNNNKIQITEDLGIMMKYPPASLYSDKEFLNINSAEVIDELIARCIDKIYDKENVYDPSLESAEELQEFISDLNIEAYNKIKEFFGTVPYMEFVIKYKNSLGNDREIVLRTLNDFFTLR